VKDNRMPQGSNPLANASVQTASFLFEIGTEELPASFVRAGVQALPSLFEEICRRERLLIENVEALGTPRRLAIFIERFATQQTDFDDEVLGPPFRVAQDGAGQWTQAALSFAKRHQVELSALYCKENDKGSYLAARRQESGRSALSILPAVLTEVCQRLVFQKNMRWGTTETAFGRPIHWFVALLGSESIAFEYAGAKSGRATRGHRFLAPEPITISTPTEYLATLRNAHVIAHPNERREGMLTALREAAQTVQGVLVEDAFLVDECVGLIEKPFVIVGEFDPAYLALPSDLIIAVMRDHQRYFALRTPIGELLPKYLLVANTANQPQIIKHGNDRVLRARLADAKFFIEEDSKRKLDVFAERLSKVTFHQRLGTMAQKTERIVKLARYFAKQHTETLSVADVEYAARFCKADLTTLTVGEFPELQGVMGSWLARHQGVDASVATALAAHYQPKDAADAVPSDALSACVALADRLDTLAGCFSVGLQPSGSADPFGLRRAALGMVRIALEGPVDFELRPALSWACQLYRDVAGLRLKNAESAEVDLDDFFRRRLRAWFTEEIETTWVDACLKAWQGTNIRDLRARINALVNIRHEPSFSTVATAYKRAFNITKEHADATFDRALLKESADVNLVRAFDELTPQFTALQNKEQYYDCLQLSAKMLAAPIKTFFDEVFVMVDDLALRSARLGLLRAIVELLSQVAALEMLQDASTPDV